MVKWLQGCGYFVLPAYAYTGGNGDEPPHLIGTGGKKIIVPDLLACRHGWSRWIECKSKASASEDWPRGNKPCHGIDRRLLEHYIAAERESGIPVHVLLWQLDTGELLGAKLVDLKYRYSELANGTSMAYFLVEDMNVLDVIQDESQ